MLRFRFAFGALIFCGLGFVLQPLQAAQAEDELTFRIHCAACHTEQAAAAGSPNERAPTLAALRQFSPEQVLTALSTGKMQVQGSVLNEVQRRLVSEYSTGKRFGVAAPVAAGQVINRCLRSPALRSLRAGTEWNGFGNGLTATRHATAQTGKFTAADLPRLKLKWAFGYANVGAARAQPTLAGGRLFVASENGEVHALDPKTGCTHWTFKAQAGVRTAPYVAALRVNGKPSTAVLFGDTRANAYGLDANTGMLLWTRKLDDHANAGITGSPVVHDGRMFVGIQGLGEEGRGSTRGYSCCTFRGSMVALDIATGTVLWKTYTIDEIKPRSKTKDGVQTFGPAGGGIWSAPSIDAKRGLVYAATGNAYADPAQKMTNAIIAFDQKTGSVRWFNQITPADNWAMGCQPTNPDNPACPEVMGPDFDFSATPILTRINGRDALVIPQKSGIAYALDPDQQGKIIWESRYAAGSGLGGQWGAATDGKNLYIGVNDYLTDNPGGMRALRLADGKPLWSMPPQPLLCGEKRPGCNAGQGGAVTSIPGAVFSGAHDGGLRAYSVADGRILWSYDMNRPFDTVNGVKANGASMDGPGPVVAEGMLFVNAGYGGLVGLPGNVLLAFGLD